MRKSTGVKLKEKFLVILGKMRSQIKLKLARIDPHMHKNAGGIAKSTSRRPFQVAEESIFAPGLAHESDPSR